MDDRRNFFKLKKKGSEIKNEKNSKNQKTWWQN